MMYFVLFELSTIGGDTLMYLSLFLVSHWLLIYIYELLMIYFFILCYAKSISYFVLFVFSTHTFMRLLSVSEIYRLIQSCCYLYLQLIDGS